MKKLIVSGFIEQGTLRIHLSDNLIIKGNRDFEEILESDSTFLLTWFADGLPKTNSKITVSSPAECNFQLKKALEISGKDTGNHTINT